MIKDQTIDEALIEIIRTKKALEALRKLRKLEASHCWVLKCDLYQVKQQGEILCKSCGAHLWVNGRQLKEHSAAKRASLDLTRKLADLRAGR